MVEIHTKVTEEIWVLFPNNLRLDLDPRSVSIRVQSDRIRRRKVYLVVLVIAEKHIVELL